MLALLDFIPSEQLLPFRLVLADVVVGIVLALVGRQIMQRLAAKTPLSAVSRGRLARYGWLAFALSALPFRGLYGPPLRMLMTASGDRPAQRFADRVETSVEIRAWTAQRMNELRAAGQSDLLARMLADADRRMCVWIMHASALDLEYFGLQRLDVRDRDAWYDLVYQASIAEARGSPPLQRPTEERVAALLRSIGQAVFRDEGPAPRESDRPEQLRLCAREKALYLAVSTWHGPPRYEADRVLAALDADDSPQPDTGVPGGR
jgi:hypothetical protein